MSFRPQPSQHSTLVSYPQAGLLRGCRGCRQTSCCSQESTPAFTMWTTEVLKILAGEAEHLHTPPCTSMHLHAPLSRLQAGSTLPSHTGKGTKTAVRHQEMHHLNRLFKGLQAAVFWMGRTCSFGVPGCNGES